MKEQAEIKEEYDKLSGRIIGAAIEVHKLLGPGLLESIYETCLQAELKDRGIYSETQVNLPIYYKGRKLDKVFRIDMLVENKIIVELKAVEELKLLHEIQLVSYLKMADKRLGLLINFNVPILALGIKRKVNGL